MSPSAGCRTPGAGSSQRGPPSGPSRAEPASGPALPGGAEPPLEAAGGEGRERGKESRECPAARGSAPLPHFPPGAGADGPRPAQGAAAGAAEGRRQRPLRRLRGARWGRGARHGSGGPREAAGDREPASAPRGVVEARAGGGTAAVPRARGLAPCGVASRERSPRRPGRRRAAAARCDKGEARRAAGEGNDRAGWSPPSTSGLLPALRGWRERVPGRGRPGGCELCTRGAAPWLKRRSALRSAAELPTMNF